MREIIIGKNGNQPFSITATGVSARHALLTIQDDGKWILKDLESKNGTYIFNKSTHCFELIALKVIDKDTIIRLGPDDTIRCCQFKAGQLIKIDQEDFSVEFQTLRNKWDEIQSKKTKLEGKISRMAFIPVMFSLVMIGLSCALPASWTVDLRMNVMRAVMILPSLLSPLINSVGKKHLKRLNEEIKETFVCPNPDCNLPLTEIEIKQGRCLKCKKHI